MKIPFCFQFPFISFLSQAINSICHCWQIHSKIPSVTLKTIKKCKFDNINACRQHKTSCKFPPIWIKLASMQRTFCLCFRIYVHFYFLLLSAWSPVLSFWFDKTQNKRQINKCKTQKCISIEKKGKLLLYHWIPSVFLYFLFRLHNIVFHKQ